MSANETNTVAIDGGSAEYDLEAAAVPITDLIQTLLDAEGEGAEYVVILSGNYRGAKWLNLSAEVDWLGNLL